MESPPKPWETATLTSTSTTRTESLTASDPVSTTTLSAPASISPALPARPNTFASTSPYPTSSWPPPPSTSMYPSSTSSPFTYYPTSSPFGPSSGLMGGYPRYTSPYGSSSYPSYASAPSSYASSYYTSTSPSFSSFAGASAPGGYPPPPLAGTGSKAITSTQATFDFFQSVVHSFGSFAAMLDSVFHAVLQSFHAVLHVAEQCRHFKHHLGHLFGLAFLFKQIKALLERLLAAPLPASASAPAAPPLLSGTAACPPTSAWSDLFLQQASVSITPPRRTSKWILATFALSSALFFLWKRAHRTPAPWTLLQEDSTGALQFKTRLESKEVEIARAMYDYHGHSDYELSFKRGDLIAVLEKPFQELAQGQLWWRGKVEGGKVGFFPANYIELLQKPPTSSNKTSLASSFSEEYVPQAP